VSDADLALMRKLDELYLEHPFMGARMLRDQLQREGIDVGRKHVTTLMQRMGITALAPQPGTSKRTPGHKIYPYLLRTLSITRPNQVWALDTTYIPMARGFVYLTAVVDVFSRGVLAHRVAITLEAIHAKEVIEKALAKYGTPEIVNTDQGSQRGFKGWSQHRLQAVHGRARRLARQRVRRAPVAKREIRAGVPEGLRQRERGPRGHRRLPELVQRRSPAFETRASYAR
jgi:putative transposase